MKFKVFCLVITSIFSVALTALGQRTHPPYHQKHKQIASEFETNVIKEINSVRLNPEVYIEKIETRKKYLRGKIVYYPKQTPFMTFEGNASMNGAIKRLREISPLKKLAFSRLLSKSAKSQLRDLIENPDLNHTGKDGSPFAKRMKMFGIKGKAGENITTVDKTPEHVVLRMVIDDGVESRTHRNNILSSTFSRIGAACGKGKKPYFICVVVFAEKKNNGQSKKPRSY